MSKIEVTGPSLPDKAGINAAADEEIAVFDQWFQSMGNDPLVRSEKAILKTYLLARLAGLVSSDPLSAGMPTPASTLPIP
jgi:hypothetical protein